MVCSLEELSCEATASVVPYDQLEVRIEVEVLPGAKSGEPNVFGVSGGGAPGVTVSRPVTLGQRGTVSSGSKNTRWAWKAKAGAGDTGWRAPLPGDWHDRARPGAGCGDAGAGSQAGPAAPARDITVALPPGLVADPGVVPRCLSWQFAASAGGGEQDECPYQSAVGAASVTFDQPGVGTRTLAVPVFDLEPEAGEPARFGFFVPLVDAPVMLTTGVRSGPGEDWGVDSRAAQIPQNAGISSVRVTFWGVPGRARTTKRAAGGAWRRPAARAERL